MVLASSLRISISRPAGADLGAGTGARTRGLQPITTAVDLVARSGEAGTSYASIPHYITSTARSLFTENYEYQIFDLRTPDRIQVRVYSRTMKGRILYGKTPPDLIREYTEYAGRMRPLPDWIHQGAIVGIQGGTARVQALTSCKQKAHRCPRCGCKTGWVSARPALGSSSIGTGSSIGRAIPIGKRCGASWRHKTFAS